MDPQLQAGIIIASVAVLVFIFICMMDGCYCALGLKKVDENVEHLENGIKTEKEPSALITDSIEYKKSVK